MPVQGEKEDERMKLSKNNAVEPVSYTHLGCDECDRLYENVSEALKQLEMSA